MKYQIAAALSAVLLTTAPVAAQVLYNNGVAKGGGGSFGMTTDPGAGFGGADASQADPGYGRSISALGTQIFADDFTIGGFQSLISSLTVYSHISNYTNTASPFTATTIDIYSGRPGDVGSSIIASSSNQGPSVFTNLYRVSSGPTLTDASRPIFATTVSFTDLTLNAGNYWFTFQQTTFNGAPVNIYGATNVVNGTVKTVSGNALAYNVTTTAWDPLLSTPIPGLVGPGIQVELPFLVNGRAIEAPPPPVAPEPGSLLLAVLPAVGVLAARYRRRS